MGVNYGGKYHKGNNISSDNDTQIDSVSGSTSRPSVSESTFNDSLDYSNRDDAAQGKSNNPELGYAYSKMVETDAVSGGDSKRAATSLFNDYAVVYHPKCNSVNDFFDLKGESGAFPKFTEVNGFDINGVPISGTGGRYPDAQSMISHAPPFYYKKDPNENLKSSTPYYPSDFIYGKHWREIPLNHQVTLRRFPFPTYDNLEFEGGRIFKPIAQAVTYFGENTGQTINDLTKFSGYMNWEELQADVNDVEGDEKGTSDSPFFDRLGSKAQNGLKYGNAFLNQGSNQNSGRTKAQQDAYRYATDPNYTNEVLGPVNVIERTNVRKRGIGATQSVTLTFEYKLRSYGNINPRIAMLDIICNMLALCYNNAKFWGGANRYFPNIQQFGFLGDQDAFYRGDYGSYVKSLIGQMSNGLGRGLDSLTGLIGGILSGDLSGIANVAKSAAGAVLDLESAKTRPKVLGFKALLTGLPIGEWHMVVGNPYRPIAMVGNLIVKNFEFELGGVLGIDDFPEDLKFTITLESGRPRDKGDLESTFNFGQGRVYYPPKGLFDVANNTSATGTKIRPNNKSNVGNPSKSRDVNGLGQPIPPEKERLVQDRQTGENIADFAKKLTGTVF